MDFKWAESVCANEVEAVTDENRRLVRFYVVPSYRRSRGAPTCRWERQTVFQILWSLSLRELCAGGPFLVERSTQRERGDKSSKIVHRLLRVTFRINSSRTGVLSPSRTWKIIVFVCFSKDDSMTGMGATRTGSIPWACCGKRYELIELHRKTWQNTFWRFHSENRCRQSKPDSCRGLTPKI